MIMRAYGGKFFTDYVNGDLTPAINPAETPEALNLYIRLLNEYGPQGVGTYNFAEIVAGMQAGKLAMTVEGTGIVSQLIDPEKSRFAANMGIALPPAGLSGGRRRLRCMVLVSRPARAIPMLRQSLSAGPPAPKLCAKSRWQNPLSISSTALWLMTPTWPRNTGSTRQTC